MPKVTIDIRRGWPADKKKALLDGIHRALVDAIRIPEWDRLQILREHDAENFHIPEKNSDQFINIDIIMYPGRSDDAKQELFKQLVDNLGELGIDRHDIMVTLHDPPLTNWHA